MIADVEKARQDGAHDQIFRDHRFADAFADLGLRGDAVRHRAPRRQVVGQFHFDARVAVCVGDDGGIPVRDVGKFFADFFTAAATAAEILALIDAREKDGERLRCLDREVALAVERLHDVGTEILREREHRFVNNGE